MKETIFIFVSILISSLGIFAQDSLLFIDAKKIMVQDYKLYPEKNFIVYKNENGRIKKTSQDNVFSIISNSNEQVLYKPMEKNGFVSEENVRYYIAGQQFVRKNYTKKIAPVSGFIVGGVSPFLIGVPISPLLPVSYSLIYGNLAGGKSSYVTKNFSNKPVYFQEGMRKEIQRKSVRNSLIAGAAGVAVGIVVLTIIAK